jgi:hypothetical protein
MEYDILIIGLKVAGIVVGSALGIAGVLFNYKSDDGRLTKSAMAVIGGILVSLTIGVIGSVAEGHKARLESLEQTRQVHQLLSDLDRSIHPITKFEITYWIKLPKDDKLVRSKVDRVFVGDNIDRLLDWHSTEFKNTVDITSLDINDTPISVPIDPESTFWPHDALGILASSFSFTIPSKKHR